MMISHKFSSKSGEVERCVIAESGIIGYCEELSEEDALSPHSPD